MLRTINSARRVYTLHFALAKATMKISLEGNVFVIYMNQLKIPTNFLQTYNLVFKLKIFYIFLTIIHLYLLSTYCILHIYSLKKCATKYEKLINYEFAIILTIILFRANILKTL